MEYFVAGLIMNRKIIYIVILLLLLATNLFGQDSRYGESLHGYSDIPETRYQTYDYYKLGFNEHGIPGKIEKKGWVEHPMYGAYLIRDYVNMYKKTGDQSYLDSAEKITNVAVSRMIEREGALIYYYGKDSIKTQFNYEYYSGLTQSNYLRYITQLYKINQKDKYINIANKLYKSLRLPKDKGGIAIYSREGAHIEEYPSSPTLWTLNGWVTSINSVYYYYKITKDEDALELANQNVSLLETKIQYYDVENVLNSRYQLSNPFYIMLVADGGSVSLTKIDYTIPGECTHTVQLDKQRPKGTRMVYTVRKCNSCTYKNGIISFDKNIIVNLVGSLSSYPVENFFTYKIIQKSANKIHFYIAQGEYNPLTTIMPTESWELLSTIDVSNIDKDKAIEGRIPIPKKFMNKIIYPTNFKKNIAGKNYNAYHFIHIEGLQSINEWRRSKDLDNYIKKWRNYVLRWETSDIYNNKNIELKKYKLPHSCVKIEGKREVNNLR